VLALFDILENVLSHAGATHGRYIPSLAPIDMLTYQSVKGDNQMHPAYRKIL
jgi:hypothetical protein